MYMYMALEITQMSRFDKAFRLTAPVYFVCVNHTEHVIYIYLAGFVIYIYIDFVFIIAIHK